MKTAIYTRVSTIMQAQQQTIQTQLSRLEEHLTNQGINWEQVLIFRDEGISGASLRRPSLSKMRDSIRQREITQLYITAPDRLSRKYVHQALLMEEFEQAGCTVTFIDRPMSDDPNDQLLLQIRGAVAEYERSLIAERMRMGRVRQFKAGNLLPWTRTPYGYNADPENPRDPAGIRINEAQASHLREMFSWYSQADHTLYGLAEHLKKLGVLSPSGRTYWNKSSIRSILRNPVYTGRVYYGKTEQRPTRRTRSAVIANDPIEHSQQVKPQETWLLVASIPAIISDDLFDAVQEKLALNKQMSRRNNKKHPYLLRGKVSCGHCQLATVGRTSADGEYAYYNCGGKQPNHQTGRESRCHSRGIRVQKLDALVWHDMVEILTQPELVTVALQRSQSGEWLPEALASKQKALQRTQRQIKGQLDRLTDAYLANVISLDEYERRRKPLENDIEALSKQMEQLKQQVVQQDSVAGMVSSLESFCRKIGKGVEQATFEQKRKLVELLIDRVIVTDQDVEIRYVLPTDPSAYHTRFCDLRLAYCPK